MSCCVSMENGGIPSFHTLDRLEGAADDGKHANCVVEVVVDDVCLTIEGVGGDWVPPWRVASEVFRPAGFQEGLGSRADQHGHEHNNKQKQTRRGF